jgi:hypothetical protein
MPRVTGARVHFEGARPVGLRARRVIALDRAGQADAEGLLREFLTLYRFSVQGF